MSLQIDIKKGNTAITSLTEVGKVALNTKKKYVDDYITVDVVSEGGVDPSDATATAADILASKTAYIASGKVTGTLAPYAWTSEPI